MGNLLALIIEQDLDPHTHPLVQGLLAKLDLEADFVVELRAELGRRPGNDSWRSALGLEACPVLTSG